MKLSLIQDAVDAGLYDLASIAIDALDGYMGDTDLEPEETDGEGIDASIVTYVECLCCGQSHGCERINVA